jgi:hypothetical protein
VASDVDICNLALARLGDTAVVTNINPPDPSKQASRCATFYPIARDTLLEMHDWGFSTKRDTLALKSPPLNGWQFTYAYPNNALNIIAILPPNAADDYSTLLPPGPPTDVLSGQAGYSYIPNALYQPQPYAVEEDTDGSKIILTNQATAVARFSIKVTDTTKFSPMFVDALAWLLASHLAGPIYKGEDGMKMSQAMFKSFLVMFGKVSGTDANNSMSHVQQVTPWISNR